LFITLFAVFGAAVTASIAARRGQYPGAFLWFAAAWLTPVPTPFTGMAGWGPSAGILLLAAPPGASCAGVRRRGRVWRRPTRRRGRGCLFPHFIAGRGGELSSSPHGGACGIVRLGQAVYAGGRGIPVSELRQGSRSRHLPVRGVARGLCRLEGWRAGQ